MFFKILGVSTCSSMPQCPAVIRRTDNLQVILKEFSNQALNAIEYDMRVFGD